MRITKYKIDKKTEKEIEKMTLQVGGINDSLVATDFSKDMYSLFKEGPLSFLDMWDIFSAVREMYVKWRIKDLTKSVDFYMDIKKFMKEFSGGELYRKLKQLPPLEALAIFLGLFKPPQQPQQENGNGNNDGSGKEGDKEQNGSDGKPKNGKGEQEEQHSKNNLPIDLENAKNSMKKINKIVGSGLFDDKNLQQIASMVGAGDEVKNINISDINKDLIDKLSNNISNQNLAIFKIARHKELLDVYKAGTELSKSEFPDNEMSINKMQHADEFFRVLPEQLAQDDDVFFMKLAKNDLMVREYQIKKQKKQALYLLIDVSGSMAGARSVYASATALSLVRQAIKNEATYFLRFFDEQPSQLERVSTKEDAIKIGKMLLQQPFSGGGTNFNNAIGTAIKDIKKDAEKFDKVEIMLITDGDCYLNITKQDLGKIKLHSTIIDGYNEDLKNISETYTLLSTRDIVEQFDLDNSDVNNNVFNNYIPF
jgi:uncharacterized protein with von Willebrand factor type A (vWA) domain